MKRGFAVVLTLAVAAFTFIFTFIDFAAPALAAGSSATSSVTIPVRAFDPSWSDTGIAVTSGETVSVSATGIICIVNVNCGSGMTPAGGTGCVADSSFLVPGVACWSLVGRIGGGPAFEIGSGASFTAPASGELYLAVNDDFYLDNSGAWTVTITAVPTLAVTRPVPGINPWNDTGVFVAADSSVSITASGIIYIAGSDPGKTPAGVPGCSGYSGNLVPDLTCVSLVGRIGNNTPFEVGTSTGFTATVSGELYLSINDSFFGDNRGAWTADITLTQADNDLAIKAPADTTVNATSASGATVSYPLPVVTDPGDAAAPAPDCSPAPGSVFPIATTTVTCTATDPDDMNAPVKTSFTITVKSPAAQLTELYQAVQGAGTGTSLADKITQAEKYLNSGDITNAAATLDAFVNEVTAQMGQSIPVHQASQLIADARRIEAAMGASDWAGPAFCDSYHVGPLQATYYGVTACADTYGEMVDYHHVQFDSAGFQCVELAARYFYYVTGQTPPTPLYGGEFAYQLSGGDYGYNVYPAGPTGVDSQTGTSYFDSSLVPGQIISMWERNATWNQFDTHVAVVTAVNVHGGNGSITVMDENHSNPGGPSGSGTITVQDSQMSYGAYNDFQWTTNLPS